jgi:hypothetical protein
MRVLLFLLAGSLFGGDLSGIWVGRIPARGGEMLDVEFKFTQTGTALEGKLYGDYRSSPIREGKVSDEGISFVVVLQEQAGNQINDTRLRFTGTLKGDEIEIMREREASTIAGNGGGVQFRGNTKTTFRLKRLF